MSFQEVFQRHKKVVIIGGGESLTGFDFDCLSSFNGAIIAVNRTIKHIPRADYWITIDKGAFGGLKNPKAGCYYFAGVPENFQATYKAHYLKRLPISNLAENKNEVSNGNSSFAALNLAYHFEPEKIVLLGLDLYGDAHWCKKDETFKHLKEPEFTWYVNRIRRFFVNSSSQLTAKGIEVVNGSEKSLVDIFKRTSPIEAVEWIMKNEN